MDRPSPLSSSSSDSAASPGTGDQRPNRDACPGLAQPAIVRWHNAVVTQMPTEAARSVDQRIAGELGVAVRQVNAAVGLLDGGATVPFIARYRKEATGALDDAQLRTLEERLRYLRELDERRAAILIQIATQGKLTDELEAQIRAAD